MPPPKSEIPNWVTYPEDDWVTLTPAQAGLDPERFEAFISTVKASGASFGGEDHTGNKWGAILTRGGYLVHAWGDRNYKFQTASVGKAFTFALVGFAVEDGLISADDLINETWTGGGQMSHPHKYLDEGHHRSLTWRHLMGHKYGGRHFGGFAIEVGYHWKKGAAGLTDVDMSLGLNPENMQFPDWVDWTGDPFYDLYAHAEPGAFGRYSSGGYWRLGQALTHLWDRDLKEIVDERLFSKIGIPADRWEWLTGKEVQQDVDFYPSMPNSWDYLDPPYEINGHVVRSGPGWAVMSASDLARFGHLIATDGIWKGERLLDPQWLRGHGGGNRCGVCGEGKHFTAMGMVTTEGIKRPFSTVRDSFLPEDVFVGPVAL